MATSKVPSAAQSLQAVQGFINTHKDGDTIGGGALYRAMFLLLCLQAGHRVAIDGQVDTIMDSKGKVLAVSKASAANILGNLVDGAGNSLIPAEVKSLRVERQLAWASLGKVPAQVKPLVLGKPARKLIAQGKLK